MLRFSGAGVSDVGRVRSGNEDSAFVGPYCAVVADGVGGAAAGEVASATAAYVVAATALCRFGQDPATVLLTGFRDAHHALQLGAAADEARAGMATTVTAVVTDGHRVVLGHVGDSRAYLLRDGDLRQVSSDHTYVQHLIDSGQLDPDERRGHAWGHVVLRSLDGRPDNELDVTELRVSVGDRLLLCSDGLSDLVTDDEIRSTLEEHEAPEDAAAALTGSALAAGGKDNVTVLVADVIDGPMVVGDGTILGALVDPIRNVVDPASVHLTV